MANTEINKTGEITFTGEEVAVIGMAGRFPGARNIDEFWGNLERGVESVSFLTDRELDDAGLDNKTYKDPDYVKAIGGLFPDKECFDAAFFGFNPTESELMDPQVRVFHECAYEALERAGYEAESYQGPIGLYAGIAANIQWKIMSMLSPDFRTFGGFAMSLLTNENFLATRISYALNLKGPAVVVQTACSTSLVAIHMACQSILNGESRMALAGGVRLSVQKELGYRYQEGGIQSSDGHCRAFDAQADGTAGGEGVGIVVLKVLEAAIADRDNILAVIKGTAMNNDGNRKVGFTAPSVKGQAQVIQLAHMVAEVEPESVSYVETHGTGTTLGDPVEFEALTRAFNTTKKQFCGIGSVKTNVGHLDSAAGIAGFIKTVLALMHKTIPPSLHFKTPNPNIDFENSPFYVNTRSTRWENNGSPLRAGVSSFGIGGTNAHIVLEEWPDVGGMDKSQPSTRPCHLLLLSAKTQTALDKMTDNIAGYLKQNPGTNPADIAYTLQLGRKRFQYRRKLVFKTTGEAVHSLSASDSGNVQSYPAKKYEENKQIVFLFSGLGSQYGNMGLGLYREEPQ
ncbi:MAG: type I polyketide synthase, partial [bacterium]|nr:type I polyketide synthase [bacterium]